MNVKTKTMTIVESCMGLLVAAMMVRVGGGFNVV
jgi:hypothetical protein